ncbi:uncharacterized protein LOC127622804 [Xyrauchen texanus]|uniref:uncharacterized protein LOC127622804 n=1 Tax=Xyrauchen texanus TaxID=154827 RepID=UPI0022422638|nr:uncharacterized protein LOC127622804 [Xyrauchen texanus]
MSDPDDDPSRANLTEQIRELQSKHDQAMAAISSLNQKSYVYVPRERHILPYCGDMEKDGRSVDDFIEEVERVLRVRHQSDQDQYDFVMSLLRGTALEEVRLRSVTDDGVDDLFEYLREAFRDRRSTPQLLHSFYSRRQLEGENIRDFSHALSQALGLVSKCSPNAIANERVALRDQFVEGVRDPSLRRELLKFVRDHPRCTMIEVRDEARLWFVEEPSAKTTKSRCSTNMTQCSILRVQEKKSVTLEDVLEVVAEQGKAISELTQAVKNLTVRGGSTRVETFRPRSQPKFTEDGQPICFKCQVAGHVAKNCPQKQSSRTARSVSSDSQGNGSPRLL